ncbi:MAG: response regulator [Thermoanaerobaculia bacterium]|nr:MAG: response regulator [Thermoanaerobaculia bacterium]
MTDATESTRESEGALRFHLSVQRSRLAVIGLMGMVALISNRTGLIRFDLLEGLPPFALAVGSVIVVSALYRAGARRGRMPPLHLAWMSLDILLVSWTIWVVRDQSPLWLIWYLTNVTAVAFVAGRRPALAAMWASCFAYLTTLVVLGKVRGFDSELALATGRLALLFGGTWFMLRGIADLREKRLRISELDAEKGARLADLRRLADELDQRTRDLAEANRRIQDANRAKSRFLANMSHELRTPLNSIIGFSEILTDKLGGRIEPRFERFLGNIVTSGRHLLGLINNILDLSKIEAGRMELQLEAASAADIVHGVASVMHGMAAQRDIRLEVEVSDQLPPIVADPPRVKQILYNLVSNAIKFSGPGQTVKMRARLLEARDSPLAERSLLFEVEDEGVGIRREDQELIFEEFRQVDGGSTRNMGGTGLGLALVKRFAEMHGGRVRVESEPGRGSCFRVHLPLDATRHTGRRRSGEPLSFGFTVAELHDAIGQGAAPRVLIAEDDDEFARALAADLAAAGYRVARARTGEEALALVRSEPPDAVALDLVLPGLDGWQVLQALKADAATREVPVIVVSLVANHELGFALGAADYFVKPLDRERFLARLAELVPSGDPATPAVLVVDDDPQIHDFLGHALEEAGYLPISALSGSEGVELAAARRPAVIVLDLLMEGMDGFQAAAELQRMPETRNIPILVFTSKEASEADRRRLSGAASGFLSKAPEDRRRLVGVVRDLAGRGKERRDATRVGG